MKNQLTLKEKSVTLKVKAISGNEVWFETIYAVDGVETKRESILSKVDDAIKITLNRAIAVINYDEG